MSVLNMHPGWLHSDLGSDRCCLMAEMRAEMAAAASGSLVVGVCSGSGASPVSGKVDEELLR